MAEELPLAAIRLMGYCRDVALMSRKEFSLHYRVSLSMTAKKQLMTFPAINTQPREIEFPWHPAGYVTATQIQEASPPLANASPSSSRDGLPAPLPHPETQTNPDNVGGILTSAFNLNPAPDVTMDDVQEQQPPQQPEEAQTNNDNVRNTNANRRMMIDKMTYFPKFLNPLLMYMCHYDVSDLFQVGLAGLGSSCEEWWIGLLDFIFEE